MRACRAEPLSCKNFTSAIALRRRIGSRRLARAVLTRSNRRATPTPSAVASMHSPSSTLCRRGVRQGLMRVAVVLLTVVVGVAVLDQRRVSKRNVRSHDTTGRTPPPGRVAPRGKRGRSRATATSGNDSSTGRPKARGPKRPRRRRAPRCRGRRPRPGPGRRRLCSTMRTSTTPRPSFRRPSARRCRGRRPRRRLGLGQGQFRGGSSSKLPASPSPLRTTKPRRRGLRAGLSAGPGAGPRAHEPMSSLSSMISEANSSKMRWSSWYSAMSMSSS